MNRTPLHYARATGHEGILNTLIKGGTTEQALDVVRVYTFFFNMEASMLVTFLCHNASLLDQLCCSVVYYF